ncbi:hypothetical protein BJ170DRAFT_591313 [Xylariales sp. AK1849]|nr:hypothetical protein BJ170DRAFT_591313 [Xylariales sp. AK1849]
MPAPARQESAGSSQCFCAAPIFMAFKDRAEVLREYIGNMPYNNFIQLSRRLFGRTARNQSRSTVSVSSSYDSPTAISTSEATEPQEAQEILDPQELQETQAPCLVLLPTELILLVSELLSAADAVCLGLTCKRMCYVSNIRDLARRLNEDDKETLLCRLERDITGVSYCVVDRKLARFTTCSLIKLQFYFHNHGIMTYGEPLHVTFGCSCFYIPWCAARLVTNHQILGPQHGLPASSLARMYENRDHEHGVCWKEAWAAKVIHGELFLSCTNTIFDENADAGTLQTYFNTNAIVICRHMPVGGPRGRIRVGLPTSVIGNTEHHDTGWCWWCETDWETFVKWTDTERGWTVTVRTYHGLGTCRSPYDPKWHAMTTRSKPFRGVPRMAVKAAWEKY